MLSSLPCTTGIINLTGSIRHANVRACCNSSFQVEEMSSKVRWGDLGPGRIPVRKVMPAMQRGEWSECVAIASRAIHKGVAVTAVAFRLAESAQWENPWRRPC